MSDTYRRRAARVSLAAAPSAVSYSGGWRDGPPEGLVPLNLFNANPLPANLFNMPAEDAVASRYWRQA